tara:strand:+ start:3213 stop:3587 length:375 start_codon:yes stop_codon:yes gene_type:complete
VWFWAVLPFVFAPQFFFDFFWNTGRNAYQVKKCLPGLRLSQCLGPMPTQDKQATRERRKLLFKVKEAADLVGVSRNTIKRLIDAGELEAFALDSRGVSHVSGKSIRRWVESRRQPGSQVESLGI